MTIRAKKSLGQHFLRSSSILNSIADACRIMPEDTVVEIGPGEGTLTEKLLERGACVTAIEKDDRLIGPLTERFKKEMVAGKFRLIHQDILTWDALSLLPAATEYVLVGNIPYYITGALFRKFLESDRPPRAIVFLVQKEVAERIVAGDGKESILSISVKAYGIPKLIQKVPRGAFAPPPGVDSAILSIENISKEFFRTIEERTFFELVRIGFAKKRKKLSSNLSAIYGKDTVFMAFTEAGLDQNARAEDLPLKAWKKLGRSVKSPDRTGS